jgi:hypothetical protein
VKRKRGVVHAYGDEEGVGEVGGEVGAGGARNGGLGEDAVGVGGVVMRRLKVMGVGGWGGGGGGGGGEELVVGEVEKVVDGEAAVCSTRRQPVHIHYFRWVSMAQLSGFGFWERQREREREAGRVWRVEI